MESHVIILRSLIDMYLLCSALLRADIHTFLLYTTYDSHSPEPMDKCHYTAGLEKFLVWYTYIYTSMTAGRWCYTLSLYLHIVFILYTYTYFTILYYTMLYSYMIRTVQGGIYIDITGMYVTLLY